MLSCVVQLWRSYGGQEAILSMQLVYQLLMREDVINRINDFVQMVYNLYFMYVRIYYEQSHVLFCIERL